MAENIWEWYPQGCRMGLPLRSVMVLSAWYRIAPVVYCDASTSKINCRSWSGGMRTGSEVTMSCSVVNAVVHSSVQRNREVFFSRLVKGLAIVVNPGMNGRWNPKTPSVLCTSFTDLRVVGQSLIPAILLGSMLISPCPRHTPKKSTSGCSNIHFDSLRKYECSLQICRSRWFILRCN